MSKPTPTAEQAAVISDELQADMLVIAGAGSGKTFTMTQRIKYLIAQGVPPERIIGLTFTNKAAAELLARVSRELSNEAASAADGADGDDADDGTSTDNASGAESEISATNAMGITDATNAMGAANAVRAASRSAWLKPTVMTYDAFFQSIVRQYGLLVGFDQQAQPLTYAGSLQLMTSIVEEHVDFIQDGVWGNTGLTQVASASLALVQHIANAMIGADCTSMEEAFDRIHAWDEAFLNQIDILAQHDATLVSVHEGRRVRMASMQDADLLDIAQALAGAKDVSTPTKTKLSKPRTHDDAVAEYLEALHERHAQRVLALKLATLQREQLLQLARWYQQRKRAVNVAEYSDFTIAAYQLIRKFPSIAQEYRQRFTHVLLDEYQDTSTTQATLLAALFHNALAQNTTTGMGSAASAVNAVGDPYQSIYAWRGASPGAFRLFERSFAMQPQEHVHALSVTRRNARIILEAANRMTEQLRGVYRTSASMREVSVKPLGAHREDLGTLGVLRYATRGQEIDGVVHFAKAAVKRVRERQERTQTAASPTEAPVALLFRTKSHMREYAQALREAGLRAQIWGYDGLLQRPEVRDVVALLHVLADRSNIEALMRLFATPRWHVSPEDLRRFARLVERSNQAAQYRALREAGIVGADEAANTPITDATSDTADAVMQAGIASERVVNAEEQRRAVREHRDAAPTLVLLGDVIMDPSMIEQVSADTALSPAGKASLLEGMHVLQTMRHALHQPLRAIIRAAFAALHIEVDMPLAAALNAKRHAASADEVSRQVRSAVSDARAVQDTMLAFADTYMREMPSSSAGVSSSLVGFMAWFDQLGSGDLPDADNTDASNADSDAAEAMDSALSDALADGTSADAIANAHLAAPDVVLLTIHKSKGLEWDAVAIVDVNQQVFPSNRGTRLRVHEADVNDAKSADNAAAWHSPKYAQTAVTWLEQAEEVPVPVRADAAILPQFAAEPSEFERFTTPATIVQAVYGDVERSIRALYEVDEEAGNAQDALDAIVEHSEYAAYRASAPQETAMPSQAEEFGKRAHDDERRLMYVALTRARDAAFVTACEDKSLLKGAASDAGKAHDDKHAPQAAKVSVLWQELYASAQASQVAGAARTVYVPDGEPPQELQASSRWAQGVPLPEGYFTGEHASYYADQVVYQAWNEPVDEEEGEPEWQWPYRIGDDAMQQLIRGAREVGQRLRGLSADGADNADSNDKAYSPDSVASNFAAAQRHAQPLSASSAATSLTSSSLSTPAPFASAAISTSASPLTTQALRLMQEHQLATLREGELPDDQELLRRAALLRRRTNVTSLQGEHGDPAKLRQRLIAMLRPIPSVSSPVAQLGTRFHAWAERYLRAQSPYSANLVPLNGAYSTSADTRRAMERAVQSEQAKQATQTAASSPSASPLHERADRDLSVWQARLITSPWAHRPVAYVEFPIVLAVPEVRADCILNGKLDAVFYGTYDDASDNNQPDNEQRDNDPHDNDTRNAKPSSRRDEHSANARRYTIVDWKTGKRPTSAKDISDKLIQLDLYRLLLSAMLEVDLDSIDARLYYLSEKRESHRQIRAQRKNREAILEELAQLDARSRLNIIDAE